MEPSPAAAYATTHRSSTHVSSTRSVNDEEVKDEDEAEDEAAAMMLPMRATTGEDPPGRCCCAAPSAALPPSAPPATRAFFSREDTSPLPASSLSLSLPSHRGRRAPQTTSLRARARAEAAAAFVVDGGIYRHDFVSDAVVKGLMEAQMTTEVPVFSVSLTPHNYQETEAHNAFFREHFVGKGAEAANAVRGVFDIEMPGAELSVVNG